MDKEDADKWIEKVNAIIRVAFNINPEELTEDEWAQRFQEWVYIQRISLDAQAAMFEQTFRKVLIEVVNGVFSKLNRKQNNRGR